MSEWIPLPYERWSATCDTLHAHTQLLGKLAVALAPPEPQLQHAALRLTSRGWETAPLPAPDGSGSLTVALDLHSHESLIEHSDGRTFSTPLGPDRAVAHVTAEVLRAIEQMVGPVQVNLRPQEVPWTSPLDEDTEHRTYDPARVREYFSAATQAALVLAAVRAPYRGRSSPVNAWWGSFDLAVSLFSGRPVDPPAHDFITRNSGDAQQIEIGWWPGDARYPRPAFFGFASPAPDGLGAGRVDPPSARWEEALGEYVLDWDDVVSSPDPHAAAVSFGRSVLTHACDVCNWDTDLKASAQGTVPAVV